MRSGFLEREKAPRLRRGKGGRTLGKRRERNNAANAAGRRRHHHRHSRGDDRELRFRDPACRGKTAAKLDGMYGTSTTTSHIEFAAGIKAGGRACMTAAVGIFFLLALFIAPLASRIPPYAAAPAIFFVASMMASPVGEIVWKDPMEYAPAVATALGMPLAYSIATGIFLGFIAYTAAKSLNGRFAQPSPAVLRIRCRVCSVFRARPRAQRQARGNGLPIRLMPRLKQNACGLGCNWADLLRKVCAQVVGEERGTKHLSAGIPRGRHRR